jgi:hypothetical protein
MTISGDPNPHANSSLEDDDVEDDTYKPSPRARSHGKGLVGASDSGRRAVRDEEIEEEVEEEGGGDDDEGGGETYVVDEINSSCYTHMETPTFRLPLNPDWREKINYKGKTDLVRLKRKENPRLVEKEPGIDHIFHTAFQQNFYESVILTKTKPVALSQ